MSVKRDLSKLLIVSIIMLLIAMQVFAIPASQATAAAVAAPSYRHYADSGIAALQGWYNTSTGLWNTTGWWNSANALEAVIDYSRRTGSSAYLSVISNTYDKNQAGNFLNDYYDDEGWWALSWIKAYDLTGDVRYLNKAKTIFNDMKGGWTTLCGGGIWWSKTSQYKNAIANELFLTVAIRLHQRTPGDSGAGSYLDWAQREWTWFSTSGMINAQNLVNDGLNTPTNCLSNNGTTWTYNQGVILGGLADLYKATNNVTYLTKAQAIADAAIVALATSGGVLREPCEPNCGADGPQFKGIFMRNLIYLHETQNKASYLNFITKNADAIWLNDRNSANQFGLIWSGPFDAANAANQSSAQDALNAAIPFSGVNLALNATATSNSSCAANEAAAYAVDGNTATKWCAGATNNQYWLQLDLGSSKSIYQFLLRHAGAGGEAAGYNTRDFTIQLSSNGTTWTTAVTVSGNTANVTSHSIPATSTRYVKLLITNPQTTTSSLAARVYEFEIYGPSVTSSTSTPSPTPTRTSTPIGPTSTRTRTPTPNPTATPTTPVGVIFYQDINYGGVASALKGKGDYAVMPGDVPNDWMSSLKVPAGWTVETYSDGGFAGTKCTFTANTTWVGAGCNDNMSSFKIY